jgi:dihydroorotase
MNTRILIKSAFLVNEGAIQVKDVLIVNGIIEKIGNDLADNNAKLIIAENRYLMPGIIDDQVHFREPGFFEKATIHSESLAGIVGGVTTYMEMPNTVPNAVTIDILEEKYKIAAKTSLSNYSFYLGGTNNNLEEIKKINPKTICGLKIFMGSSTGNMLVENDSALEAAFINSPTIIATHCEDENTIMKNNFDFKLKYGPKINPKYHPLIRNEEACYLSSSKAVALAKKHNTKLHVLHISTAKELSLFDNKLPLEKKKITAEACVHHLFFNDDNYTKLGNQIKCNPAIKTENDRSAIFDAVNSGVIDVIATDHAPHTRLEKNQLYWDAPSGLPLIQHGFNMMLSHYENGKITLEKIVQQMCHNPAILFNISKRGFIREGYYADLVLFDLNQTTAVRMNNLYYKCKWSPLIGQKFLGKITHTLVNGQIVYENGMIDEKIRGMRLEFDR